MTTRPMCPRASRKQGDPCLYCAGVYCAHQYYCPATRRYENTDYRRCKRLYPPKEERASWAAEKPVKQKKERSDPSVRKIGRKARKRG